MNTTIEDKGGERSAGQMYEFSADGFDFKTATDLLTQIDHIKRNAPGHMAQSEVGIAVLLSNGLNAYFEARRELRIWSEAASGKVPRAWGEGPWYNITSDLESNDELTPDMIDAAVHHPHRHVVVSAAQHRLLTADQMQYVQGWDLAPWERESIDVAQQQLSAAISEQ